MNKFLMPGNQIIKIKRVSDDRPPSCDLETRNRSQSKTTLLF